ncbi:glycosyltransferase 8 domain-containing protein 1 [Ixodes scapularis]
MRAFCTTLSQATCSHSGRELSAHGALCPVLTQDTLLEYLRAQRLKHVPPPHPMPHPREKLFKQEGPVPALLLALHNKTATLDPQWHVRNLGVTAGTQYSRLFVSSAKLLHWSGRFKPWSSRSPYADIWHRYFVPDPTGRFRPASKSKHRRGTTEGPSVRQLARRPVNGSV